MIQQVLAAEISIIVVVALVALWSIIYGNRVPGNWCKLYAACVNV